ncbi:MAG: carbohydrate ABC transporter permease [Nitrospiraceae bacterium]
MNGAPFHTMNDRSSHPDPSVARGVTERAWGYLFATPALLLLLVLAVAPIQAAIWLGFQRHLPIFQVSEFVGLGNYLLLMGDERFWAACRTTLYFTGISVGAELALGLGLALILHRLAEDTGRGGLSLQVIILIPWVIPTVVSAEMWDWLYQADSGLLNYLLLSSGVIRTPINWLEHPAWALHAAILMDVWKTTPFAALLLLAGLKAIPRELYLAARVDGAGRWAMLRRITLPLLLPVMLIVLVFRTMDAVRAFDAIFVLTGGGPGNSTETLSIYAYKMLFQTLQFGYGSTLATTMFLAALAITSGYLSLLRRHLKEVAR